LALSTREGKGEEKVERTLAACRGRQLKVGLSPQEGKRKGKRLVLITSSREKKEGENHDSRAILLVLVKTYKLLVRGEAAFPALLRKGRKGGYVHYCSSPSAPPKGSWKEIDGVTEQRPSEEEEGGERDPMSQLSFSVPPKGEKKKKKKRG